MSKKVKIIYLTIFSCLFVVLFSNLPVFAENPLPVSGRCLSLSNSREFGFSDISEWIEIATFENYSLILRKLPIEYKKSLGTSSTKKYINDWF